MKKLLNCALVLGCLLAAAISLCGCGKRQTQAPLEKRKTFGPEHYFHFTLGDTALEAQLAIEPEEMRRGLMRRREMDWNRGMLFVYDRPRQMTFWMRNTYIPLDIGFFKPNGVLHEVYPMYPHVETPVRSRSESIQFALEMNQGWFAKNGLRPGAQLGMTGLKDALRARGFQPGQFHLEEEK